jgi:hypothetical protein
MTHTHEDVLAVTNTLNTYAWLNDEGDWPGVAQLLSGATLQLFRGPDALPSDVFAGREQIAGFYDTVQVHDGGPCTRHLITNVVIEMGEDGVSAQTWAYFTVIQSLPDFPLQPIVSGRYRDAFAKGDDGWHFTRKEIFVDHTGDVSRHAPAPTAALLDAL